MKIDKNIEYMNGVQAVGGSNPLAPTILIYKYKRGKHKGLPPLTHKKSRNDYFDVIVLINRLE